jgi:large subunit ribosomal protein L31
MKTDIHPNYQEISTTCSCGNVLPVMSTLKDGLSLDVCSKCHPFYTGKQKMLDSGGRVKKFQDRFGASGASKPSTKKDEPKVEAVAVEDSTEETLEAVTEIIEEVVTEDVPAEEALTEEVVEENVSEEATSEDAPAEPEQAEEESISEEAKD